jgi:hypothetical protein
MSTQDPSRPQDPDATMLVLNPGGRRAVPASASVPVSAAPAQVDANASASVSKA